MTQQKNIVNWPVLLQPQMIQPKVKLQPHQNLSSKVACPILGYCCLFFLIVCFFLLGYNTTVHKNTLLQPCNVSIVSENKTSEDLAPLTSSVEANKK